MKKNGFTLIELISVLVLLGLLIGIAAPNLIKSSNKAKQKSLVSKIKNIEKSAVLFIQDINDNSLPDYSVSLNSVTDSMCSDSSYSYCCDNVSKAKTNCSTVNVIKNSLEISLTVESLAETEYIKYDNNANEIQNPVNKNSMNNCKINIYKKYGRFYATYIKLDPNIADYNKNCWFE